MEKRTLGKSDIKMTPLVFGGNVFGWTLDENKSFAMLDSIVDHGLDMIDTANVYSMWVPGNKGGESETILGNWFARSGKRDKVLIATKVGMEMGDGSKGLKKDYILKSAEDSLRRLKTDRTDVYYAHQDDKTVPFEETMEAFVKLLKDGKVRHIASSNYDGSRLEEILKFQNDKNLPPYIAHQPEYNLFDRQAYEEGVEKVCASHDLGVVTYFSLASGFLSGKYRDEEDLKKSNRGEAFLKKYMTPRGLKILKALDEVAHSHGLSQAAVSLAWILHRPSITAPIVSATSNEQLDQLVSALQLKLSKEDMKKLNEASSY